LHRYALLNVCAKFDVLVWKCTISRKTGLHYKDNSSQDPVNHATAACINVETASRLSSELLSQFLLQPLIRVWYNDCQKKSRSRR